jgi:hypothetical protein
LRARGESCQGNPQLKVYVDGALKGTVSPNTSSFADYSLALSGLSSGTHTLRISFENDRYRPNKCDRNAYLDYYVLTLPDSPPPSGGGSPVLVGAGDIASGGNQNDEATAKLIRAMPDATVFTAGDNAYENGTLSEFNTYYGPTWGTFKDRTHPAVGNHEYHTAGAAGYFDYFGPAAGNRGKGYYSYDLGLWHIIALNSACNDGGPSCAVGSTQYEWLRNDLLTHQNSCTLAYDHHPRYSSGPHGNQIQVQWLYNLLYDAPNGAEVFISGHDHMYERFAPQDKSGIADSQGIRQFVVGTGGREHYDFSTIKPNSEYRQNTNYGVLKLTLHDGSYDWQFVNTANQIMDSGTGSCHN